MDRIVIAIFIIVLAILIYVSGFTGRFLRWFYTLDAATMTLLIPFAIWGVVVTSFYMVGWI